MRLTNILLYSLLLIGLPAAFLALLEVTLRVLNVDKSLTPQKQAVTLEMPTWMMGEANSALKAERLMKNPEDVKWIKLFERGDGFRARLVANVAESVKNTFTKVKADTEKTYLIKSNSVGFRGPEPEGAELAVYGDSSSFGWGIDFEKSYSPMVANEMGLKLANFAIPGDSSEYGKLIAEKYMKQYPAKTTIISFGANDAKFVNFPHRPQIEKFRENLLLQRITYYLSKSAIYRSLDALLTSSVTDEKPAQLPEAGPAVPRKQYKQNLTDLVRLAKETGSKSILLLAICTPGHYAIVADRVARQEGVHFLNGVQTLRQAIPAIEKGHVHPELAARIKADAGEEIERDPTFWVSWDGCHPNELGNRIIADKITQILS